MRFRVDSWIGLVLAALLVCSAARPHDMGSLPPSSADSTETETRNAASFLKLDLWPRIAALVSPKPAPKPAPAPPSKPKPVTTSSPKNGPPVIPPKNSQAPVAPKNSPAPIPPKKSQALPPPRGSQALNPPKNSPGPSKPAVQPPVPTPPTKSTPTVPQRSSPARPLSPSRLISSRIPPSSGTPSPKPKKLAKPKCGFVQCRNGTCPGDPQLIFRGKDDVESTDEDRDVSNSLNKRVYQDINNLLASGTNTAWNRDLTDPNDQFIAATNFIPFTGNNRRSVRAKGLHGCTIVAAFSPQGMIVNHLFEMGVWYNEETDVSTPRIPNTLHPAVFDQTMATAVTAFQNAQAQLAGGQLHIMIPVNSQNSPTNPGAYRYNTDTWAGVNADHSEWVGDPDDADDPNRIGRPTTANDIIARFQTATNLVPTIHRYEVSNDDDVDDPSAEPGHGTFVLQYDPNSMPNTDTPRGVQLYIEMEPQLNTNDPAHGWNFA